MRSTQIAMTAVLLMLTNATFAALVDDVGDADSFGRSVKYLGAKSAPFVYLEPDCSLLGTIQDRCVNIAATGSTSISQSGLITFKIPAFSTRSLVCFSYNLYTSYEFANYTAVKRQSQFSVRPTYTIESSVLNNPSIIDPFTSAPANGKLVGSLSSYNVYRSIGPGDYDFESQFFSRQCSGGLISKAFLQSAGLTSSQIAAFFASPITITIASAGSVSGLEYGGYQFGFRLFGD